MRVAIHQPQYISWIGYFNKILRSDIFVYYDDCQYQDRGLQNRNLILNYGRLRWLSVPLMGKKRIDIDKIRIDNTLDWQKKHRDTLVNSYGKSKYFKLIFERIAGMYKNRWDRLADLIIDYDDILCELLRIKTKRIRSSRLALSRRLKATDKLIAICKKTGATRYLSGPGGKKYMEIEKFENNGIVVDYQKFSGKYVGEENPSILDFLFKYGADKVSRLVREVF